MHENFNELLGKSIPDDEKLVHSVKELWEDERRRRQARGMPGPHPVRESGSSSQRVYSKGEQPEWAMESDFRQQIATLVEQDSRKGNQRVTGGVNRLEPRFESFVKPENNLSKLIPTAFQAVEAIHISRWIRDEADENPFGVWAIHGIGIARPPDQAIVDGPTLHIHPNPASDQVAVDACAEIDVLALQSQMQDYKDEAPDEDNDGVANLELDPYDDADIDLNWDELDELDIPHESKIGAGTNTNDASRNPPGSKGLVTPRKARGAVLGRDGTASPASKYTVTPRKANVQNE